MAVKFFKKAEKILKSLCIEAKNVKKRKKASMQRPNNLILLRARASGKKAAT